MTTPDFTAFSLLFGEDPELLAALRERCSTRRFDKGEIILNQQETSTEVHYLLKGFAKAQLVSAEGKEVWMNEFRAGAMFGELAVLAGAPRVCSVVAFSPCQTAVFRGESFIELMRSHGELGLIVSRLLAERLNMTSQRLYMASAESLEGRVIVELKQRAVPLEVNPQFTHVIRPAPVIAEIARKVGSARESVSRLVALLSRDEYILRKRDEWLLRDPQTLVSLTL
jgi:CRP-like cAMP-binding protein